MKIGIIGSGNIGAAAAQLFVAAGHEVAVSNSRGPESLAGFVAELGLRATAATLAEAAASADLVLVAIPLGRYESLAPDALRGRIVIDAMNYYPQRDGNIAALDSGEATSSELVAAHLRGARVVKAFNTIRSGHLSTQGSTDKPLSSRRAIFVAGDDEEAKRAVAQLIESIGFAPYDMGRLADGRNQQPGTAVYDRDLTADEAANVAAS